MRWITVILLFSCSLRSNACFGQSGGGARAIALGSAYAAISDDAWAPEFNPGGLAQLQADETSFFYSPQPFGLNELSIAQGVLAVPTNYGVVGFSCRRYGYDLYREVSGSVSYANTVRGIGLGVSLNCQSISIRRYGTAVAIGIDAGVLASLSNSFRWGFAARNINAPLIGVSNERLPQTFTGGIAYIPVPNVILGLDYRKETHNEPSPRFGLECRVVQEFAIRLGCSDAPPEVSGGFGVRYSSIRLDYAFSSHTDLGWTHQASVSIAWGGSHE